MVKLNERQFYCVLCKARRTAKANDISITCYKNKRALHGETPALRAVCSTCGTQMTKWVKYSQEDRLKDKYPCVPQGKRKRK